MSADEASMCAWNLGMSEAGWSEATMDRAEMLIPTLVKAGYVTVDDESKARPFSNDGVSRVEALERGVAAEQPGK